MRRGVAAFRLASPEDLETLLGLQRDYYAEDGYPYQADEARLALAGLLHDPSLGKVWVAEHRGEVAGYLVLTLGYSLEYRGRDAFVDELYLRASHRGCGLGRVALEVVEAACRELGVRALHLEVEPDKPRAVELYRRAGFRDHQRHLMTKRIV